MAQKTAARGRPKGTGLDDAGPLAAIAELIAANPGMNKVILLTHMQQIAIELKLAALLTNVDIIVAGGSLASGAAWFATGGHLDSATPFHGVLFWMALLNLLLGAFNLLPGFPMDGGRVLRSILWRTTGNYRRATRIASIVGQLIGWAMVSAGVAIILAYVITRTGPFDLFDGICFIILGWFLSSIAASTCCKTCESESSASKPT